jgi:hypothetical protein
MNLKHSRDAMLIEKNNALTGSFSIEGDLAVAGALSGEAAVRGAFVVEKEGNAEGMVRCSRAVVAGRFSGTLTCETTVLIEPGAQVQGRVLAREVLFGPPGQARKEVLFGPPGQARKTEMPEQITQPARKPEAVIQATGAGKMPLVTGTSGKLLVRPTTLLKGSR